MSRADEFPELFRTSRRDREPLLRFMVEALEREGCHILFRSSPTEAPFRITFETPEGERMGIVAYAFLANAKPTRNRPDDEYRFQMKYGPNDGRLHRLWQDPYGLYTTLLVGISPELGFFVGADPEVHNPTRFFISLEFKQREVSHLLQSGWHAWERERRSETHEAPVEVLVGGTQRSFLRFIRFEREAFREDAGHRQLLAEGLIGQQTVRGAVPALALPLPSRERLHALAQELALDESEVLDLIAGARRLKMAVRGWVAEEHLVRALRVVPGVTDCARIETEGGPDVSLLFQGSKPILIECKNVLREMRADGPARIDFQRTRVSKNDPCSRYYSSTEFAVLAACLHAVTGEWRFNYVATSRLAGHATCTTKLSNNVRVDERWSADARQVLASVVC